ncbi:hypothetical protein GTW71_08435, partial [Streptomyces sp. SID6041]|nr:hypothetical protein [Streptomyces sp. SID6041]
GGPGGTGPAEALARARTELAALTAESEARHHRWADAAARLTAEAAGVMAAASDTTAPAAPDTAAPAGSESATTAEAAAEAVAAR